MYITTTDLIEQWITGDNTYLTNLITRVESIFHTLIWLKEWENLLTWTKTEEFENLYDVSEKFLKYPNITSLTSINWVAKTSWDYKILWYKIILKDTVSIADVFPNLLTFIYVAWYSTTPWDIKQVLLSLSSYINNMKTNAWISGFSQDLLTVNYWAKEVYDYLAWLWQNEIINKYKIYYAYSL